tara:strand:- start:29 stop:883 length:855 start_codon:yes stop_codon:yes gene_type:complete
MSAALTILQVIARDDAADLAGKGASSVPVLTRALKTAKSAARGARGDAALQAALCEVQWRLSRAHERKWSIATKEGSKPRQQQSMRAGLLAARGAVATADALRPAPPCGDGGSAGVDVAAVRRLQHLAHKWAAIFIGYETNVAGTKQKLTNLPLLLAHAKKASSLNPADATCHQTLGQVCFSIAGIGRAKRTLARTFYGATIPPATYADALRHFEEAEKAATAGGGAPKPMNRVWLARTCGVMGDARKAKQWAAKVLELPCRTAEEARAHREAKALLGQTRSRL